MKKPNRVPINEMRSEYDFTSMKGGVRGKYVRRARQGTNIVLIEPEIAGAFPTEEAVNEALKGVLSTTRAVPEKALQPTGSGRRKTKSRKSSRTARR